MSTHYKDFPPGWGHLKVPTGSRRSALAALALYAPCRRQACFLQRAAWVAVKVVGPRALPGRAAPWAPRVPPDVWHELVADLTRQVGAFDAVAGYERLQPSRAGFALLLLRDGVPVAFAKLREGDGAAIVNEYRAAELIGRRPPQSFAVPRPLAHGAVRGWHYLVLEALAPRLHRPPKHPALGCIIGEIQDALSVAPRPAGIPAHWQAMHGDFAPWNLRRIAAGSLVLIDWEDAAWGPAGADEVFYRAAQEALALGDAPPSPHAEAIHFWTRRVEKRPDTERDQRLAAGMLAALGRMGRAADARGPA